MSPKALQNRPYLAKTALGLFIKKAQKFQVEGSCLGNQWPMGFLSLWSKLAPRCFGGASVWQQKPSVSSTPFSILNQDPLTNHPETVQFSMTELPSISGPTPITELQKLGMVAYNPSTWKDERELPPVRGQCGLRSN